MPPPQAGSVILYQIYGYGNNQVTITNLHYWTVDPWATAVDEAMFYDQLFNITKKDGGNDLITPLTACCSVEWKVTKIRIQEIFPIRKFFKDYVVDHPGTNPGFLRYQNLCSVITKKTQFGGRRYVGRWRIPGLPADQATWGQLSDAQFNATTNLGELWSDQIINPNGEGHLEAVIYHPKAINQSAYDQILSIVVQRDVRTQRTRNLNKGI